MIARALLTTRWLLLIACPLVAFALIAVGCLRT